MAKMGVSKEEKNQETGEAHHLDIKLYARRWFLMLIFMWFLNNVSMHWMQFSTVTNVISRYYNVPEMWVESTSTMCMGARVLVLFPALFLIEKLETRNTIILASASCLIGSSIKALSVAPDRFYIVLIGQVFSAFSLVFTYSLVARFSAAWFSSKEISTAGALGCVGDQMGGAFGFLVPSLFVPDSVDAEVEKGLQHMHYFYTTNALVTLILIVLFFKSKPKRPPSAAQVHTRSNKSQRVFKSVKTILNNPSFLMFALSHAFLLGAACNGYGTLLNQLMTLSFPSNEGTKHTGLIGFVNYCSGMTGSVVVSYILDKTRKYKGNAVTLSTINCICLILCAISIRMRNIVYVYVSYTIFGFFLQAYYATGIQMGIELTFPVPEGITVATMSVLIEIFSIIATIAFGYSVRRYGGFESTMCMVFLIFLSTIVVCLVPPKFRREQLEKEAKSTELKEFLPNKEEKPMIIKA